MWVSYKSKFGLPWFFTPFYGRQSCLMPSVITSEDLMWEDYGIWVAYPTCQPWNDLRGTKFFISCLQPLKACPKSVKNIHVENFPYYISSKKPDSVQSSWCQEPGGIIQSKKMIRSEGGDSKSASSGKLIQCHAWHCNSGSDWNCHWKPCAEFYLSLWSGGGMSSSIQRLRLLWLHHATSWFFSQ